MKIIFIFFITTNLLAQDLKPIQKLWPLQESVLKELYEGKIIADTNANTIKDILEFEIKAMALYKNNCKKMLKKFSLLENYPEFISFVKKSSFDENKKLWTLVIDHSLLPFSMLMHILTDRPTKVGIYHYQFPTGFLKDLKGTLYIIDHNNRCLLFSNAFYRGVKTKFPDTLLEFFSKSLLVIGGEYLMRKI